MVKWKNDTEVNNKNNHLNILVQWQQCKKHSKMNNKNQDENGRKYAKTEDAAKSKIGLSKRRIMQQLNHKQA